MSSICGMFRRDGRSVGLAGIRRMVDALSHWHPDDAGAWAGDRAGLGHAALHIAPESGLAPQPWISAGGDLVVTADARIDNRDELRASLGVPIDAGRVMPDCLVIAEAYRKWGTACPAFLEGDFAFALWDAREQRLFCARDILGVRPFYYSERASWFAFASEIKGIFAHPDVDVPRTLDESVLAGMLLRSFGDRASTVYEHVKTLPAAHTLTVSAAGLSLSRYWRPEPDREVRFKHDEEYVEAYRELLERAVTKRVRTTAPLATTLAGIDSASVTWFARKAASAAGNPIVSLSWAHHRDASAHAEGRERHVDVFLAAAPMAHEYVYFDTARFFHPPAALLEFHDGPIRDRRFDVMMDTFASAASHGARVVLFGLGGDELATSQAPDYLLSLLLRGRAGRLVAEMRAQARARGESLAGIVRRELLAPLLRGRAASPGLAYRSVRRPLSPEATAGRPDFLRAARLVRASHPSGQLDWRDPVRANQIALTFGEAFQHRMETRYAASALFRLECRFPLFDRRLIEFCLGVPAEQHRSDGHARRLVRRAMAGRVPDAILWGRKDAGARATSDWSHYASEAAAIRAALDRWRQSPAVSARLDLPRMESLLQAARRHVRGAAGHFERAFLLASFLEWHDQR